MTPAILAALIAACSPNVAPATMAAVVHVESKGNPIALNVNKLSGRQPVATLPGEAVALARRYIALGHTVDVGLAQVNSANFRVLGLTPETAFEPCANLRAGARILHEAYEGAERDIGPGQTALRQALSAYNTGNRQGGFRNGYVAKYYSVAPILAAIPSPARVEPPQRLPNDGFAAYLAQVEQAR